jgi:putative phosphoesterase
LKIVVFADSHKDVKTMEAVIKKEKPQTVIHLGDHITDGKRLQKIFPDLRVEMVPGNTDAVTGYPSDKIIEWNGKRIFITHGDRYDVNFGLARLFFKGLSEKADIILFGHTHSPLLEHPEDHVWVMNPGSIRASGNSASYGIILLKNDKVYCSISDDISK